MLHSHFPYPVTIRLLNGYFEVSAPDFGIIKAQKRLDELQTAEELGSLVLDVINEALKRWDKLEKKPTPSKPRGALDSLDLLTEPLVSIREVQSLLQVSDETVRRLCKKGELSPLLTSGGHRRFKLSDVKLFLEKLKKRKNRKQTHNNSPSDS